MGTGVKKDNAYDCGVRNDGSGLHGMQVGKLWRTEEGRALVQLELIRYFELFAEPWYALGLGVLEVVDCEGHIEVLGVSEPVVRAVERCLSYTV